MRNVEFNKEYLEIIGSLPDSLEEYQFYLGLKERKIYFNYDVDTTIVNKIVYWIQEWNREDEELNIPIDKRKTIQIYITSDGGDVVAGFSAIDAIKSSKTKVETIGVGSCVSMGALLLISGHYRKAYPNTIILIHDGSMSVQSTSKKAKNTMNFYDRLDNRIKDFIVGNTNISEELYDEKGDEEWYMFANDEGLSLGIVHEII
ncbi:MULTISPECIES: ClpP family protease [Peribacillus]|uniref:ClpP family protease n=1 Tax=Peribacillus TaxID=2675229 RepID=UPI001F4EAB71|nr:MULTISPECIES: ATP-dependent Clp protease proteolytic subunit [unclassified Peribacillus]MCK1982981.1 ATP-dependent Clp protease proteolytic subunit [Peribacillus sp. Aquil_B1]MCK2011194.1 ATP-dependent Clp protease proteolytic subunit [Peribacillus sp. Aquil_B8]